MPAPRGNADAPLRALIFDSYYDRYRGAIPSIRVVDGTVREGMEIAFGAHPDDVYEVDEVGYLQLGPASDRRARGRRGRLRRRQRAPGARDARGRHDLRRRTTARGQLLPGYRDVKSMVFAGIYPTDSDQYEGLRDALEKLQLNDASLHYEPETSTALGFGFRCGFLGLLHMEIVQERLEREFDLEPDHHGADRGVPRLPDRRRDDPAREPEQAARPGRDRPHRGAVREGAHHGAGRVHRRRS